MGKIKIFLGLILIIIGVNQYFNFLPLPIFGEYGYLAIIVGVLGIIILFWGFKRKRYTREDLNKVTQKKILLEEAYGKGKITMNDYHPKMGELNKQQKRIEKSLTKQGI